MYRVKYWKQYPAWKTDLAIIAALSAVLYLISGTYDLFESIHDELEHYEGWQLDEAFIIGVFLAFAMSVFSLRRWRELAQALNERDQTLDELRVAKDQAESANRTKGEFLANMSHEIRTPMNAIMGMTDLTLDTELTKEQCENLQIVKSSATSLLQILNDILDFSKIEAGKLELDCTDFSLRNVLDETVKALGLRAHEKDLELTCRVNPQTSDNLIGDPLRLRQVLVNLIGNAIKFTEHGEVVVSAESEPVDYDTVRLHLAVRDTGIGIRPHEQTQIFKAFTQADGSSTRRFGGTGLGLAISTRLVSLMRGHIWVESEYGKGSTFHFTALFGRQRNVPPKRAAAEVDLTNRRVLIVDDNSTNRAILEEAVGDWRMQPASVDNGPDAIGEMRRAVESGCPFALMLLDSKMPGMDGFEVASRCQADPRLAGVTIMMLSSSDGDADSARCRELGIAEYLRKPVTRSELHGAIVAALGRTRTSSVECHPTPPPQSPASDRRPLTILLAEDNVVNQRVTVKMLERRGHSVQAVNNGNEALEAVRCERFDLVLMDVQMPEMDGLEATAALRRMERQSGGHVPIIALTAHAMKGDRERCLDAGMDDYLAKPVHAQELEAMLERWCYSSEPLATEAASRREPAPRAKGRAKPAAVVARSPADSAEVFDMAALRARVEDDLDLLTEMIDLYLESSPQLLHEIEAAVADRDSQKIARGAHTLKGVLRNMCADACADAALQLETVGKSGSFDQADQALAALKGEYACLNTVLSQVAKEPPA